MAVSLTREWLLANGIEEDLLDSLLARSAPSPEPGKARSPVLMLADPPRLETLESGPGWWRATLANWRPASKNVKVRGWRTWHRARRIDDAALALWSQHADGPPPATGRRRLTALVERRRASGRMPDPQNLIESLCDSCVNTGLLLDDSSRWLDLEQPIVRVNKGIEYGWMTTLILEDIADDRD